MSTADTTYHEKAAEPSTQHLFDAKSSIEAAISIRKWNPSHTRQSQFHKVESDQSDIGQYETTDLGLVIGPSGSTLGAKLRFSAWLRCLSYIAKSAFDTDRTKCIC